MSFLEPARLVLLLAPVALAIAYLVMMRRREIYAVRFTNLELLDQVAPDRPGWRRHAPAVVLLTAMVVLALAVARPATTVQVPRDEATVVLAIDVSLSMDATDVDPNRIDAAKEAARSFLDLAPEDLKVGIVSFSGTALPILAPTTDRAAALRAIDSLRLGEGTAIGEGIYTSVRLIESTVVPDNGAGTDNGGIPDLPPTDTQDGEGEEEPPAAAVVVLSDGETTMGRLDLEAAQVAADGGIPVSTISFGTDAGVVTIQGEVIPVPANDGALREVADLTGGEFFEAASASELEQILDNVGSQVGLEDEEREITDWFAAAGLILVLLAAAGSLAWFSRIP